jgi:hypothetical protein
MTAESKQLIGNTCALQMHEDFLNLLLNNEYQHDGFSQEYVHQVISGKEFTSNDTLLLMDYYKEIEKQMFVFTNDLNQTEKSKKVNEYLNNTNDGQTLKT